MSANGELKNALSFLQGSICRGDLEAAYPDRLKLRRMLREGEIEDEELRLGALVLHAHLSLPQIERVAVSESLARYYGESEEEVSARADLLRSDQKWLAGALHVEIGNANFRDFKRDNGLRVVTVGVQVLEAEPERPAWITEEFACLYLVVARIWQSRLTFLAGSPEEGIEILRGQLDVLSQLRKQQSFGPGGTCAAGCDWATAIALDVLAELLHLRGDWRTSLEHSRLALNLYDHTPHLRDRPRLGHLCYVAGKAESDANVSGQWRARQLFERSMNAYGEEHPFYFRTVNQDCRTLVREGDFEGAKDQAEQTVGVVQTLRRSGKVEDTDADYNLMELTLTWTWASECALTQQRAPKDEWALHLSRVQAAERVLNRLDGAPRRLRVEFEIRKSVALLRTGQPSESLAALESVRGKLASGSRPGLVIAWNLATAEALIQRGKGDVQVAPDPAGEGPFREESAKTFLDEADRLFERQDGATSTRSHHAHTSPWLGSRYLSGWRAKIAYHLQQPTRLVIPMRADWESAEDEIRVNWLRPFATVSTGFPELEEKSGVNKERLRYWAETSEPVRRLLLEAGTIQSDAHDRLVASGRAKRAKPAAHKPKKSLGGYSERLRQIDQELATSEAELKNLKASNQKRQSDGQEREKKLKHHIEKFKELKRNYESDRQELIKRGLKAPNNPR